MFCSGLAMFGLDMASNAETTGVNWTFSSRTSFFCKSPELLNSFDPRRARKNEFASKATTGFWDHASHWWLGSLGFKCKRLLSRSHDFRQLKKQRPTMTPKQRGHAGRVVDPCFFSICLVFVGGCHNAIRGLNHASTKIVQRILKNSMFSAFLFLWWAMLVLLYAAVICC